MMKKIAFIAFSMIALVAGSYVFADPKGRGTVDFTGSMIESLNLTTGQMEKVRDLRGSYLKEKEPLQKQLFTRKTELRLLWMHTKTDAEKIKSVQKEIHDLQWTLLEKRTNFQLAFRNILNPEQLSKYIHFTQDRKRSKKKKARHVGW